MAPAQTRAQQPRRVDHEVVNSNVIELAVESVRAGHADAVIGDVGQCADELERARLVPRIERAAGVERAVKINANLAGDGVATDGEVVPDPVVHAGGASDAAVVADEDAEMPGRIEPAPVDVVVGRRLLDAVIAGAIQCVSLPVCVVLIHPASVDVPPRIGARFAPSETADGLVWLYVPLPRNESAADPIRPGVIHCGRVVPTSVPLFVDPESATRVPAASSK